MPGVFAGQFGRVRRSLDYESDDAAILKTIIKHPSAYADGSPGGRRRGDYVQNPLLRLILLNFAVGGYHSEIARRVAPRPISRA